MVMQQQKIDIIQDGEEIPQNLVTKYGLSGRDFIYFYSDKKEKNVYYSNFVGLIRSGQDDSILFSMPKHYMNKNKFLNLELTHQYQIIKSITKSINKAIDISQFTHYKHNTDVVGTFSFEAYHQICNYYQTYGLYRNLENYYKKGSGRHISWKKTISLSNEYFIDGKLMIIPFVTKKKLKLTNIITDCMIFVLNYTQAMYGNFIEVYPAPELIEYGINPKILENVDGIIEQLFQIKTRIFKDKEKQLIDNLIIFLKRVNSKSKKVSQAIKDYNYEHVWEKAVEKYLNIHFDDIKDEQLIFSKKVFNKYHFKKISSNYDKNNKKRRLEPDHYYFNKESKSLYIFDSKYYIKIDDLNHKQLIYHFLFGNKEQAKNIYDALIVPYEGPTMTEVHVNILSEFLKDNQKVKIYLCKLNSNSVIKEFIK